MCRRWRHEDVYTRWAVSTREGSWLVIVTLHSVKVRSPQCHWRPDHLYSDSLTTCNNQYFCLRSLAFSCGRSLFLFVQCFSFSFSLEKNILCSHFLFCLHSRSSEGFFLFSFNIFRIEQPGGYLCLLLNLVSLSWISPLKDRPFLLASYWILSVSVTRKPFDVTSTTLSPPFLGRPSLITTRTQPPEYHLSIFLKTNWFCLPKTICSCLLKTISFLPPEDHLFLPPEDHLFFLLEAILLSFEHHALLYFEHHLFVC